MIVDYLKPKFLQLNLSFEHRNSRMDYIFNQSQPLKLQRKVFCLEQVIVQVVLDLAEDDLSSVRHNIQIVLD